MENILDFHQITARVGTAGQPKADQFPKIKEAGYTTVINLAMSNAQNAVPEEENIVTSLGLTYLHLPVPWDKPNVHHVRTFFGVMDALSNEKVFVHCAMNLRVSAFMHQYLTLKHGIPSEEVTSPALKRWLPKMDENWKAIMNLTAADLGL